MSEQARQGSPSPSPAPEKVRRALAFYKVMAIIAGTAVLILLVVVVIRYGFDNEGPSKTWSPIHGWLYMVYAASVINLGFLLRWSLGRMVLTMLCPSSRGSSSGGWCVRSMPHSPVALSRDRRRSQ
jgi:integral membrane protein